MFKKRLGTLDFFDPACGSGNFLTETYISLRKIENRVLQDIHGEQMAFGEIVDVTIDQFHGIEINDFAVEVAKTALWIAELQMNRRTMEQVEGIDIDSLPLSANENIVCGNALRMDWSEVVPAEIGVHSHEAKRCADFSDTPLLTCNNVVFRGEPGKSVANLESFPIR